MKELTDLSYNSIKRYFNTLSLLGYKNYKEVDRLIILLFIEELLSNMSEFVTESDYRDIISGLECLYGSTCLIGFPSYNNYDSIYHNGRGKFDSRISENNILRVSQRGLFRAKA